MAWQRGIRDIEVQSDAKNVLAWIQDDTAGRGPIRQYLDEVKRWTNKDWKISFRPIYREQNRVADCLASLGALQGNGPKRYLSCPIVCEDVYLEDMAFVTRARRVAEE